MCLTLLFSALSLQCAPGNPGEAAGSDRYGQKMSELEIRPAAAHDAEALIAAEQSAAAREHLRERWAKQCRGEALFLLAHHREAVVGHTLLLRESKYAAVRAAHRPAEINALSAYVRGAGIGTAIIAAAEAIVADWGRDTIGLAVGRDNPDARRLYERLGYREWTGGGVLDEWTEKDADGTVLHAHRDSCDYLLKRLPRGTSYCEEERAVDLR
jgi:GNAT superfamily N-acetyltransferase